MTDLGNTREASSDVEAQLLRTLLDQMPGILWTVDRDLRFTSSLGAALPALGLQPNQVVGMTLFEYFGTEDPDLLPIAAHRKALEGKESEYEFSWEERKYQCHVEPFRDESGAISGAIGVAFDMTEAKRAAGALKESEHKYRTLFEESRDALYVSTIDGRLIDFNQSMLSLFGYTREEMGQLDAEALYLDPADRRAFREQIERHGAVKDFDVRLVTKDGRVMDCLLNSTLQYDEHGEVSGYKGAIRDIGEQKRAGETLRRERDFSEAATDSLPGLFYLFDEQGRFLRWNRNLEHLTGYSARQVAKMSPLDFFVGEDRRTIEECIREAFDKGQTTAEVELVARDGGRIPYFFTGELVVLDGRRCVVGTAIDLVERRRLETQLRQSQKMEAIGRLAGGVAHDFNNVLTVILSNSEMLAGGLGPEDPRRQELIEIRDAAQRAATLTRQLLAFSRKQVLKPRVLSLNAVVVTLEKMLRRLIGEDIDLATELQPNLWAVEADPGQLEQIIMNLAVNARDAMPEGGRLSIETGNAEIDEGFAKQHFPMVPGRYVMLAVCDSGAGMDAETQRYIFEPFFTTKSRGTGLGLSMVYGIVKQSGGYIWAYSEPGQGAKFEIYFPCADGRRSDAEAAMAADPAPPGKETVLLAEDEDSVRRLARRILEEVGYTVLEAREAMEALTMSERWDGPIDLLLTDVVMPELNGRELAERLSVLRPGLQILYISGYTDHEILDGIVGPGNNFLQKPFTPDALANKVREILDAPEKKAP
ncbi:MAG: PAS domain S-box protein [Gemmatimonadota bacterium]|nr:MAG: PAS domain S-box protein [Gemmatimonadota bacterium]